MSAESGQMATIHSRRLPMSWRGMAVSAKMNSAQQSGDIQQSHASGYDGTLAYIASKLKYRAKPNPADRPAEMPRSDSPADQRQ
jgi:hypothetical protein